MMRDERTTVSPFSIFACLWLSTAARDSADMGSPCVPLISTQTFSGGKFFISPGWISMPSGIWI